MAIRKPSLSVKEARHLAGARNAALDSDRSFPPVTSEESPGLPLSPATGSGVGSPLAGPLLDAGKEASVQVFLSALLPADGVSGSYDFLSNQYPPAKALRMILRRALDNYEILLEKGGFETLPAAYPVQNNLPKAGTIQTSRMMPVVLLKRARAFFDPLGFESDRAFGRKLASAALAAFFATERRR